MDLKINSLYVKRQHSKVRIVQTHIPYIDFIKMEDKKKVPGPGQYEQTGFSKTGQYFFSKYKDSGAP